MMMHSHCTEHWESNPDTVGMYLFGDDFQDRREEVGRGDAQLAAAVLGTTVPSEDELMQISDDAERKRGRARR